MSKINRHHQCQFGRDSQNSQKTFPSSQKLEQSLYKYQNIDL